MMIIGVLLLTAQLLNFVGAGTAMAGTAPIPTTVASASETVFGDLRFAGTTIPLVVLAALAHIALFSNRVRITTQTQPIPVIIQNIVFSL